MTIVPRFARHTELGVRRVEYPSTTLGTGHVEEGGLIARLFRLICLALYFEEKLRSVSNGYKARRDQAGKDHA